MSIHLHLVVPVVMGLALMTQAATADEHREHGPHVHGIAHLNIAFEDNALEIELDSPAANLVGFEHVPRNDAERAQLAQTIARLRKGETLFILPAPAGCLLESVQVIEEGDGHHEDEMNHTHDDGEEEVHHHSALNATYRFHCDKPALLDGFDVRLFEQFPATERLEVQIIGPQGQGGRDLTASNHYLRF